MIPSGEKEEVMKKILIPMMLCAVLCLAGCVNDIELENATSQTLDILAEVGTEVLADEAVLPGESISVRSSKGAFKATATGTNYSETIEETLSSAGTYKVEFAPDGASLWRRIGVSQ
jgi:hypothetical protein